MAKPATGSFTEGIPGLSVSSLSGALRIRVRKVESGDLQEVVGINRRSFVLPYTVSVFREFYNEHRYAFLVADHGGRVVGYAMSRILRKLDLRGFAVKKIGHIMSVAVEPEFRRRGIGKQLLARTMEVLWENGASELRLEVRVSNRLAIEMYRGAGFSEGGILHGYYSDGEDAVLMTRPKE